MANQRVIDYIKAQLPRGYTREQIKKGLVSQGWPAREVDEAMKMIPPGEKSGRQFNESVPGFVKFFGILYYIAAGLMALGGGLIILEGGIVSTILGSLSPSLAAIGGVFLIFSIPLFGFAVLDFFIGRGLFKRQKWARIIVIIFAIIGVAQSVISIPLIIILNGSSSYSVMLSAVPGGMALLISPLVLSLVLSGLIASYLIFSKKVKAAFL